MTRATKNTVEKIDNALKTLRELKPVTFYYNEEYSSSPERLHYGFIAQEYQKVMPDATYFDESIGKLCIEHKRAYCPPRPCYSTTRGKTHLLRSCERINWS